MATEIPPDIYGDIPSVETWQLSSDIVLQVFLDQLFLDDFRTLLHIF
jgi:hypothetical protein